MSVAWTVYRAASWCAGVLAPAARVAAPPAERALWGERLGTNAFPPPADAWVHAASLGESTGVAPFAAELRRRKPDAALAATAMTLGGRERLSSLALPAALAPIDTPQAVERFLRNVEPRRLFLVETELWPQWLMAARRARLPVAVVSARLSARSVARYRWLGGEFRGLMSTLAGVCCQNAGDRARWTAIGVPESRVAITGNLKWDGLPEPAPDRFRARAALGLDPDRPLLVLGSVRPGEAALLARALRGLAGSGAPVWQIVAVPRHPAASAELQAEAARAGQALVAQGAPPPGAWAWVDRLGVLAAYYAAADAAFVGGSLVPLGGHNPLEPAATGAAVLMGPHHETQRDAVELLSSHRAIELVTPEAPEAFVRLLTRRDEIAERGRRAREAAESQRGSARRTVDQLVAWELWGHA